MFMDASFVFSVHIDVRKLLLAVTLLCSRSLFGCDAPRGIALDELRYAVSCGYSPAAVAATGSGAFAAWHMTHAGFGTISGTNYGLPLDANGHAALPAQVDYDGGIGRPVIATDGRDFLLVSYAQGATGARVVRADGTATPSITLTPLAVSSLTNTGIDARAFAVWTGSDYLVMR
jgi:hypothetical protein